MTTPEPHADSLGEQIVAQHPEYTEPVLLEEDETVPPRPEEDAADTLRS
ncbi:hypothetical protein [Paraoerskovia marina]|nr:hypothetical protein [Paraoerskovia marina]